MYLHKCSVHVLLLKLNQTGHGQTKNWRMVFLSMLPLRSTKRRAYYQATAKRQYYLQTGITPSYLTRLQHYPQFLMTDLLVFLIGEVGASHSYDYLCL